MMKNPPFQITTPILNACMQINRLLGMLDGLKLSKPALKLRRENRVKTIQASLAIEGNTLSLKQVGDILDGAVIIGPEKEILEVKNAIAAYDMFGTLRYTSMTALHKTHKTMMKGLVKDTDAGQFRTGNVGVFAGAQVTHVAPPYKKVPQLMRDLFSFIQKKDDISLLVKSCVFHYELEFIHPYADGNGRMGRFWQHLILTAFHPIFEFVSIEGLIKFKQQEYYAVLAQCDHAAESTHFIAFFLELIVEAMQSYTQHIQYQPNTAEDRLFYAKTFLLQAFTRKDYLTLFKNISTATASRDLKIGVDIKLLSKSGDKRLTLYRFQNKNKSPA